MASSYEDTLLDFDISFLHETSNNVVTSTVGCHHPGAKPYCQAFDPLIPIYYETQSNGEKQRKAVLIAKKKIISTDLVVTRYKAKKTALEQMEKTLYDSKEECKQVCIDYKNVLEKCTKLEKEAQILRDSSKEFEMKYISSENRCGALQSHASQLQMLVKENETRIEAFKIENQLEKTNVKKCEKKMSSLKKYNDSLISHIGLLTDIVFGKKKLNKRHKLVLQKFMKSNEGHNFDNHDALLSEDDKSSDETDVFEDLPMSPASEYISENNEKFQNLAARNLINGDVQMIKMKSDGKAISNKDDIGRDSDCSNEVVSIDTGRGSSLAFSDIEKCFHSPDYFLSDSPLSTDIIRNGEKRKHIDIATSPITVTSVTTATSPVIFADISLRTTDHKKHKDVATSPILFEHISSPLKMIDKSVNTTNSVLTTDISTSPIREFTNEVITSPIMFNNEDLHNDINGQQNKTMQEKVCLESNNSINLCDNNSEDCEIQMILSAMRFNQKIITPIPDTPAKSCDAEVNHLPSSTFQQDVHVCEEALKIREENKILQANVADLAKEIANIKILLHNKLLIENNVNSNNKDSLECCESLNNNNYSLPLITSINENICLENTFMSKANCILKDLSSNTFQARPEVLENIDENSNSHASIENDFTLKEKHSLQSEIPISDNEIPLEEHVERVFSNNNNKDNSEFITNKLNDSSNCNDNRRKTHKVKKLTKLEKLKKRLLPRGKIKSPVTPPVRKLQLRPKKIPLYKKKITESDSSVSLNEKMVYENAVKVMTEIRSKQKTMSSFPNELHAHSDEISEFKNNMKDTQLEEQQCEEIRNHQEKLLVQSLENSITTRSRSKHKDQSVQNTTLLAEHLCTVNSNIQKNAPASETNFTTITLPQERGRLKRNSVDKSEIASKRYLRSSAVQQSNTEDNITLKPVVDKHNTAVALIETEYKCEQPKSTTQRSPKCQTSNNQNVHQSERQNGVVINYSDIDIFTETKVNNKQRSETEYKNQSLRGSILCLMLEKYGMHSLKYTKKPPESVINNTCKIIEENITRTIESSPNETKRAMDTFVEVIENMNIIHFLSGLMKYLKNPTRKIELFSKEFVPPAPPMTKSEQILLYVISRLRTSWPSVNIVNCILNNIEYTIFQLNHTPEFDVIESMSHFYAVLCRYFRAKSRVRLFVLDAMYCIQFKSVPLIKQCLEVWSHILPLAHMGIARTPLVTCLIFLLHFYKCDDRYNRVQDIRNILSRRYSYQITDWNQTKILEMFRNAIKHLKDILIEKKMLRMALIILAKRQGPRWCQKNIIKNMLLPMIKEENVPDRIKQFCVSMLGPLLKPYPKDMKIDCEITITFLMNMLNNNPSHHMEEAILISLIYLSRHNQNIVIKTLLSRKLQSPSSEFEASLRDFVREKPWKWWKNRLSKMSFG